MSSLNKNKLLASVLYAADNSIVGRIRIQKIFYLLEQMGLNSGIEFSYYHYGPYSDELSSAIELASREEIIKEDKISSEYGVFYAYSSTSPDATPPTRVGNLSCNDAKSYIKEMKSETSIVLELAATIHWLQKKEKVKDWEKELKIRKGTKAEEQRVKKAITLLQNFQLLETASAN